MAEEYTRIQIRKGTDASFRESNPVLDSGEPAFAVDTNTLKIGNGTHTWSRLAAISGGSSTQETQDARSISLGSTSYSSWLPTYEVDVIRITSLAGNTTISGIDKNFAKKQFLIVNSDNSDPYTITIEHNNSSAGDNGIYNIPSNDVVLRYGDHAVFTYDSTASKWIALKTAFTANATQALTQSEYDALIAANNVDPNVIYLVT